MKYIDPASQVWNKGRVIGPKKDFEQSETQQIADFLETQNNYRELCLFTLGVDSGFRCSDLLRLKVWDVFEASSETKTEVGCKQQKTRRNVWVPLSSYTQSVVRAFMENDQAAPSDYLFTASQSLRKSEWLQVNLSSHD